MAGVIPDNRMWLRLEHRAGVDSKTLATNAASLGLPLDVSSNPALWGEALLGTECEIVVRGGKQEVHRATERAHAADLIHATLIALFASLQRARIEVFVLEVADGFDQACLEGAVEALLETQEAGHVRAVYVEFGGPRPLNWVLSIPEVPRVTNKTVSHSSDVDAVRAVCV